MCASYTASVSSVKLLAAYSITFWSKKRAKMSPLIRIKKLYVAITSNISHIEVLV